MIRAQLCLTLCDPMDCSLPGSSVHGIFQGRILERVAISFSRGSSQPRDRIHVSCISCIGRLILYHWDTWEAPSKYWKSPSSQRYGFSSSYAWMWEFHYKESWTLKNWCFWTVVLERSLESSLDSKEIKPVNPKGNQSWIFIGRTDAGVEAPILWPLDEKKWLIWKDPDAGKDWRQEEKGTTEDEMVGWHHQRNGHEFEQALGVGDGQGSLACCSPWGCKESDTTERLNWTELTESLSLALGHFRTYLLFRITSLAGSSTYFRPGDC